MPLVLDGTNGVSGVDGTASNPAIEGTDSNTGIFYPAADTVAIGTGGTERLRVDSAGNAGLGVTPNTSWSTGRKVIQIGTNGALWGVSGPGAGSLFLSNNTYFDGTNFRYLNTSGAGYYAQATDGSHSWNLAASGTAGNAITFTQAMTLDASGNLGVGITSPVSLGSNIATIDIGASSGGGIRFRTSGAGNSGYLLANASGVDLGTNDSVYLRFVTAANERARITSGGVMLLGTTSTVVASNTIDGLGIDGRALTATWGLGINSTSATGTQYFVVFGRNSSACGTISSTTTNSTTYATSSDYRLKENIQPMIGALAKVAALKPCTYTWKEDGSAGEGFIAHELAEVCPQAVVNEKDAINEDGSIKPQGVDTSFLVATLTAAIQELNAKVEAQAAEIAALKGTA